MRADRPDVMLRKAQEDLTVVALFHEQNAGTDEPFGFYCQQAIEKAMKSVLGRHGIDYPWTHDLTRLLLMLDKAAIAFPPPLREADLYTLFAVRFRYEDLPEDDLSSFCFFLLELFLICEFGLRIQGVTLSPFPVLAAPPRLLRAARYSTQVNS